MNFLHTNYFCYFAVVLLARVKISFKCSDIVIPIYSLLNFFFPFLKSVSIYARQTHKGSREGGAREKTKYYLPKEGSIEKLNNNKLIYLHSTNTRKLISFFSLSFIHSRAFLLVIKIIYS